MITCYEAELAQGKPCSCQGETQLSVMGWLYWDTVKHMQTDATLFGNILGCTNSFSCVHIPERTSALTFRAWQ